MEGLYKLLLAALLSALIGVGGAWFAWARDTVTEAKAIDLIESHSPYLEDRKVLEMHLEESAKLREDIQDLVGAVKELAVKVEHNHDDHHGEH